MTLPRVLLGGDIAVENFGLSQDNTLDMVMRNSAAEEVEINEITLSQNNEEVVTHINEEISVGDSTSITSLGAVQSNEASSVDVKINYNLGGLSNQVVSGTVSGNLIVDSQEAAPNDDWAFVDVSEVPQETVDTNEMGDFYIMKYEASREGNATSGLDYKPVSREGHVVWDKINQTDAIQACRDAGFELPSNRQWQASTIAEIGDSNTQPIGNNGGEGVESDGIVDPTDNERVLTGTGPESWSNQIGVYDLNGNVWEWTSTVVDQSHPMHFGGDSNDVASWNTNGYPQSLGASNSSLGNDEYWSASDDGRAVQRGGDWHAEDEAGVFSMSLNDQPSYSGDDLGFRCIKTS